jgi:hypothetical protein
MIVVNLLFIYKSIKIDEYVCLCINSTLLRARRYNITKIMAHLFNKTDYFDYRTKVYANLKKLH